MLPLKIGKEGPVTSVHDFVAAVRPGDHIVLFYETLEFKHKVLFTYLVSGLERGITALYVSHKEPASDILSGMQSFGIEVERYARMGLFELWEITPDLQPAQVPPLSTNRPPFGRRADSLALLKAYLEGKTIEDSMVVVADDPLHNMKPEMVVNFEKFHSFNLEHTPISMICTYSINEVSQQRKLFLDLVQTHHHIIIQTYGVLISSKDRRHDHDLVV